RFGAGTAAAPAANPLRVMRATPATPAEPDDEITIMFDRPVAGGLDATVRAEEIFRIEPPVAGRVEWRDPVTLRFVPAERLEPGRTYVVRIAPSFAAMDGSQLEREVRGGSPSEPERLASYGRISLDRRCGGGTVALRGVGIRPVAEDDPSPLLYTGYRGNWPRDPERDLRRVVRVTPAEPLPLECVA